jgi:hypothetical protein
MVTVNVVVLAGTVAAEPVERRMPSGDEVTELLSRCHLRDRFACQDPVMGRLRRWTSSR